MDRRKFLVASSTVVLAGCLGDGSSKEETAPTDQSAPDETSGSDGPDSDDQDGADGSGSGDEEDGTDGSEDDSTDGSGSDGADTGSEDENGGGDDSEGRPDTAPETFAVSFIESPNQGEDIHSEAPNLRVDEDSDGDGGTVIEADHSRTYETGEAFVEEWEEFNIDHEAHAELIDRDGPAERVDVVYEQDDNTAEITLILLPEDGEWAVLSMLFPDY